MTKIMSDFRNLLVEHIGEECLEDDKTVATWCSENQNLLQELSGKIKQEIIVGQLSSLLDNYPGDSNEAMRMALDQKRTAKQSI